VRDVVAQHTTAVFTAIAHLLATRVEYCDRQRQQAMFLSQPECFIGDTAGYGQAQTTVDGYQMFSHGASVLQRLLGCRPTLATVSSRVAKVEEI
jgi:hypothetical protein